jgi:hypothetical protein
MNELGVGAMGTHVKVVVVSMAPSVPNRTNHGGPADLISI